MGFSTHPNWGDLIRVSKYIDGQLVQQYAASMQQAARIEREQQRLADAAKANDRITRRPTRRNQSTPLRGIYLKPRSDNSRECFGVRIPPTTTSIAKVGAACAWWQSCGILAESLGFEETPTDWLRHVPLVIEGKIRFIHVPEDEIHEYAPYWAHEGRIRAAKLLGKPVPETIYYQGGNSPKKDIFEEAFAMG